MSRSTDIRAPPGRIACWQPQSPAERPGLKTSSLCACGPAALLATFCAPWRFCLFPPAPFLFVADERRRQIFFVGQQQTRTRPEDKQSDEAAEAAEAERAAERAVSTRRGAKPSARSRCGARRHGARAAAGARDARRRARGARPRSRRSTKSAAQYNLTVVDRNASVPVARRSSVASFRIKYARRRRPPPLGHAARPLEGCVRCGSAKEYIAADTAAIQSGRQSRSLLPTHLSRFA